MDGDLRAVFVEYLCAERHLLPRELERGLVARRIEIRRRRGNLLFLEKQLAAFNHRGDNRLTYSCLFGQGSELDSLRVLLHELQRAGAFPRHCGFGLCLAEC